MMSTQDSKAKTRILYGVQPVREMLTYRASEVHSVLFRKNLKKNRLGDLIRQTELAGISIQWVDHEELTRRCDGGNHQGIALIAQPYRYFSLSELLGRTEKSSDPNHVLLLLDQLQDPQNLGGIIRSAAVFGALGVVLTQRRSVHISETVTRVSAGATERVSVVKTGNLNSAIDAIKEHGFWVYGTALGDGEPMWSAGLTGKVAFVIGSEGPGIRPLVAQKCDLLLTIPMEDQDLSLNAAHAATLCLYESRRQSRFNDKALVSKKL